MSGPGDIMVSLDLQVGEIAPPSVPIEVEADASKLKLTVKVGHIEEHLDSTPADEP